MDTANVIVSLGGDSGNSVHKYVTAAEIAVLRAIHGEEAVNDIQPLAPIQRSNRAERERLFNIYGAAKHPDSKVSIVDSMFPGVAARVFETIAELELDDSSFKATGRMKAPAALPAVDPDAGPTIAEWVGAGYSASAYPPSGFTSKSTPEEIAAAVAAENEAKAEVEAEEGVGEDINDGHGETENVLG